MMHMCLFVMVKLNILAFCGKLVSLLCAEYKLDICYLVNTAVHLRKQNTHKKSKTTG